jgi:hypothetical protein
MKLKFIESTFMVKQEEVEITKKLSFFHLPYMEWSVRLANLVPAMGAVNIATAHNS